MKRVIIESPYAGDTVANVAYLKRAILDALGRGEAPFASHLFYTQVLDDNDAQQRKQGMRAGFAWFQSADLVAVYTDLGISGGMRAGIQHAGEMKIAVEHRSIGVKKTI